MVQVHIIECKDLRAKDSNGVSDPQVTIEVMGRKEQTKIKRRNLNPFYDETFSFNFKDLKKEQVAVGKLVLRVADCDYHVSIPSMKDFALSDTLIGSYSLDLLSM